MSESLFVFDIETVPDADDLRRSLDIPASISDEGVIKAATALRRAQTGSDFLKHCYHKIVAISLVMITPRKYMVFTVGQADTPEKELIERFFNGIDKFTPNLVSWNGSGFDLPVLHYRAMKHCVPASRYFEVGQSDPSFRYNNYQSRYHQRHLDLMDVLANYSARGYHSLNEIASLLGYPGKLGMSGEKVAQAVVQGQMESVRNYCETDVANTYLVYLHYQRMSGQLSGSEFDTALVRFLDYLKSSDKPHLIEFAELIQL